MLASVMIKLIYLTLIPISPNVNKLIKLKKNKIKKEI
jgi:hypothetical protein